LFAQLLNDNRRRPRLVGVLELLQPIIPLPDLPRIAWDWAGGEAALWDPSIGSRGDETCKTASRDEEAGAC
jgi:hypothetical protein